MAATSDPRHQSVSLYTLLWIRCARVRVTVTIRYTIMSNNAMTEQSKSHERFTVNALIRGSDRFIIPTSYLTRFSSPPPSLQ